MKRTNYSWPEESGLPSTWRSTSSGSRSAPASAWIRQYGEPQTSRNFAWRDYGNRIGNWRLFEILDELKLPASILLNSMVSINIPEIVEKIKQRGDDVLGHGRTNAEVLRPMWEHDEARAIQGMHRGHRKARRLSGRPDGWARARSEFSVTPDLLKEAGYTHLLDWPVDDQPIWMQTRSGPLLSVPYPMELNDAGTLVHRDHTGREFGEMIVDQFEELLEQSERQPLVFSLALQRVHRRPAVPAAAAAAGDQALRRAQAKGRVWFTRAGEIAKYCVSLPAGAIPGGAKK